MTPFLKQLALDYLSDAASQKVPDRIYVFPSHRAGVFFIKYISEAVKDTPGAAPLILPKTLSVDEFFAGMSRVRKADEITLLKALYDCYPLRDKETPDEFLYWGGVILADFDDIDKYNVDAGQLLRNVSEYRAIGGDFSDLSETQLEAIRTFLGHFNGENGRKDFKERFLRMWDMLLPMYKDLHAYMEREGVGYTGFIYRKLLEKIQREGAQEVFAEAFPDARQVYFCGLNALCECEKKILDALRNNDIARFCWDYVSPMIRDPHNKSSFFLKENVLRYPQAVSLEKCDEVPQIEVIEVPSAVGQTKVLADILSSDPQVTADERTAVVIPDERLLLPLLQSLPEKVVSVNVTMGYPMGCSSFFSLIKAIGELQMTLRHRQDGTLQFYHRPLWTIVANNIFASSADTATLEKLSALKKRRRYYVDAADLPGSALTGCIFCDASDSTEHLAVYLKGVVQYFGASFAKEETKDRMALELDEAMECDKALNLLDGCGLDLKPATFLRLLETTLRSRSIPFKGEPLRGLQIMGPLEVRALDFDNMFILSSNESVFPRRSLAPSFIPPLLRRGFDLPTYEYQDAVWAYYFYRMIQRPKKVWMLLDSRTDGLKSGEESRYIKQLEYYYDVELKRSRAAAVPQSASKDEAVEKTPAIMEKLHAKALSATSLKAYLNCPMQFYYSFIEGLSADEDVAGSMDAGMIGKVFHKVMEHLYDVPGMSFEDLGHIFQNKAGIAAKVREAALEVLGCEEITGRDIVVCRLIEKYVLRSLEADMEFLKGARSEAFRLFKPEDLFSAKVGNFKLIGYIDRLDTYRDGALRIVDYKTGRVLDEDEDICDENAVERAEMVFDPRSKKRPEIALQFFIYDYLLRNDRRHPDIPHGVPVVNCVYSVRKLLGQQPVEVPENKKFYEEMLSRLERLLSELDNPEVPFTRCEDSKNCKYCDFKTICGR